MHIGGAARAQLGDVEPAEHLRGGADELLVLARQVLDDALHTPITSEERRSDQEAISSISSTTLKIRRASARQSRVTTSK